MFGITEKDIKAITNEVIYERGMECYKDNRIKKVKIINDYYDYFRKRNYVIGAEVESSSLYKTYYVQIRLDDRTGVNGVYCDCEAFKRYKGICKHTAAVLIKLMLEADEVFTGVSDSGVNKLIQQLTQGSPKIQGDKKEINLEIKYIFQNWNNKKSSVELKIGDERLYVVKNIREFLKSIEEGNELEFGKKFTFNPLLHKFNDVDKKILDILLDVYDEDKYVHSTLGYYSDTAKFISGKEAFLTRSNLKKFLDTCRYRYIKAKIDDDEYDYVGVFEEKVPLEFKIKQVKSSIAIEGMSNMPLPLTVDGEYLFYNGSIYKASLEFTKTYMTFYNFFKENKSTTATFKQKDSEKIASYILPSLKKISSSINIDSGILDSFREEPLNARVYLDKNDDNITASLKFIYGGQEIDPLVDENRNMGEGILIRDVQSEISIKTMLTNFGFKAEGGLYSLENGDKIIDFVNNGVFKLQELCEIYYSDAFKNIKLYNSSSFHSSLKLNDEDLLQFTFEVDGIDSRELKSIFSALRERKKYHRLKSGGFIDLEDKNLKDIAKLMEYLDVKDSDLKGGNIQLSKYQSAYIDQFTRENELNFVEKNKRFRETVNNLKDINESDFKIPKHLEKIMRNYQKSGFKWFKTLALMGFGGILADEMGLGKTLQTIAFISSEKNDGEKSPCLIVVPTSLIYNWESEIQKFSPELSVLLVDGNREERFELLKNAMEYDIVITSYPLIRRDIDNYKDIVFKYCILDEAQNIKNPESINAKSVKDIRAKNYFALTGTPIENSLTELWSIFDFIMPGYLLSHNKFMTKYERPIIKHDSKEAQEELNKHIKPFILRRLKKDVIKELPPKIRHNILIDMTEEQKKVYAAYLEVAKDKIDEMEPEGFNKNKIIILSLLTRLRQICCDPSVFIANYNGDSGKLIALEEIIQESLDGGHRILIFSQFTSVLKKIEERIKNIQIDYFYLDGTTKTIERLRMVDDFNNGARDIFLISLKAGGTGLNLTGADTVIHFDPWWNPAVEDQATDRAHRIGQLKTLEVIKLISRGTIEEKIYKLQEKKREIVKNVMDFDSSGADTILQMSQEEIREIFSV